MHILPYLDGLPFETQGKQAEPASEIERGDVGPRMGLSAGRWLLDLNRQCPPGVPKKTERRALCKTFVCALVEAARFLGRAVVGSVVSKLKCPVFVAHDMSGSWSMDRRRGCGKVGIPRLFAGFPSAVENLFLVFHAAAFPQPFPGDPVCARTATAILARCSDRRCVARTGYSRFHPDARTP